MKKQLQAIIITATVCISVLLLVYGIFLVYSKNEREAHMNQTEQYHESESNDLQVVVTTPEPDIESELTITPTDPPTATPTITPTPTVTSTVTPEITVIPTPEVTVPPTNTTIASNGHIVAIDAGHQRQGNYDKEPLGPGSSEMKAKVSSGTTGRYTGVYEYVVNLDVSLLLRDELESRGYQVVMIRETHDVNISNSERAAIANNSGAEIFVRIHCNGVDDSSVKGALTMAPTSSNPYVGNIASQCERLSQLVVDEYCAATGFKNKGIQYVDNMSGINWCTIPVTIVEMGFMTNPDDDAMLVDPNMQIKMADGIANGIDAYFGL